MVTAGQNDAKNGENKYERYRGLIVSTEASSPRFTQLLVATVVGVYLLVVVGATASLADSVRACSTWPVCSGPLTDLQLAIAMGHRAVAVLVFGLLCAACLVGFSNATAQVKATLVLSALIYPVQIGVGALVATSSAPVELATLHLLGGGVIFVALALGLAWQLEAETGSTDTTPTATPSGTVSEPTSPEQQPHEDGFITTIRAYYTLMKPRLMWLLCLVAGAGMALAASTGATTLTVRTAVLTLGGGILSIGASGTFNHVLERDVDRRMARTADRPLATDTVGVRNAILFGATLALGSLLLFAQLNALAAALGLFAIVFYSVIYTLVLKPNTVQNTVLGGLAGAIPALIGWAGVTGRIDLPALVLAALIFAWTPAHFYNLALAYRDDYERGGFPMMPVVRGETTTRKHIIYYLVATLLTAIALTALTPLGWLYASATVSLGGLFLWFVVKLHREQTDGAALRAFHASNAYLGVVLVSVIVDAMVV